MKIKIHIMHCGSMLVSPAVPCGGGITLKNTARELLEKSKKRIELPVSAYLIEHPKGLVLIDTGWSREISPNGVYDERAVRSQLPAYLASFYRPTVRTGETVLERLAAMGIAPKDLDAVVLTHLDADHISGLRSVNEAKRILCAQEEGWWNNRTVYRLRQPESLREGIDIEFYWFRGTPDGPLRWSYDLFGDGSVKFICLPGHTDGHIGVRIENNGRFLVLASDAAFSERSWREGVLPAFGFNETAIKKSYEWLRAQAADPACVGIIANHDPKVRPQVIEL